MKIIDAENKQDNRNVVDEFAVDFEMFVDTKDKFKRNKL